MPTKIEKDEHSGTDTTGHVWDGVRELNTPLPKWWVWVYAACVVWGFALFLLYPSIPYGSGYFHGLLGYSSRVEAMKGVAEMHARHAADMDRIASADFATIKADPKLVATAEAAGRIAFANNCQPCHGAGGEGHVGYPALGDDVWLWGGKVEDIAATITHGIRSTDADARNSQMPSFGADGQLTAAQIGAVADYVSTLYGIATPGPDVQKGAALFADNCAVCHGDKGQGNREVGAPPLAAKVHLYGNDRATIVAQITRPRMGVMPNWNTRLDPATIKSLALYVHALGGGE